MEIIIISAALILVAIIYGVSSVQRAKVQYGVPKEIQELKDEMAEYRRIINSLDEDSLEHLERRIGELTGQIRENNVKGVLGRR